MANFLDTIKVLGTQVKDAGVETANSVLTDAATATAGALQQAIKMAADKALGKATPEIAPTKQPPVGKNADGTPTLVLPENAKVTNGQVVVSEPKKEGVPAWVWYAGGGFMLLIGGLVTYKVLAN